MQWHPPPPDYFRVFKDEATSLQPPPLPDTASSNGISELARRVFIRGEPPPPLPPDLLSSAAKSAAADPSNPDPRRLLENKTAPEVAAELKATNKRVAASLGKVGVHRRAATGLPTPTPYTIHHPPPTIQRPGRPPRGHSSTCVPS